MRNREPLVIEEALKVVDEFSPIIQVSEGAFHCIHHLQETTGEDAPLILTVSLFRDVGALGPGAAALSSGEACGFRSVAGA